MDEARPKKKCGPKRGVFYRHTKEQRIEIRDTFKAYGFDPVAELIEIGLEAKKQYIKKIKSTRMHGAVGFLAIAQSSMTTLIEYIHPKMKSLEVTGKDGEDLFKSFTGLIKKIADGSTE